MEDGPRTVSVYVDGDLLDEVTTTVTTLGHEVLWGVNGEYVLEGFPDPGTDVTIRWDESLQNFVIADFNSNEAGGPAQCVARFVRTHVDEVDLAVRYNCGTQTFTIRRESPGLICLGFFERHAGSHQIPSQ